jgi:hypothetical protein
MRIHPPLREYSVGQRRIEWSEGSGATGEEPRKENAREMAAG